MPVPFMQTPPENANLARWLFETTMQFNAIAMQMNFRANGCHAEAFDQSLA
jgi:hypothetical protein